MNIPSSDLTFNCGHTVLSTIRRANWFINPLYKVEGDVVLAAAIRALPGVKSKKSLFARLILANMFIASEN
jgi:hypothetical protein